MPCLGVLGAVQSQSRGVGIMGVSEFLMVLAGSAPALVLWIAVVIFAAIMLRRGGGRAERFLVAGASLKIIGNLLGIATITIAPWLADKGYSMDYTASALSGYGIFLNVVSMAGIICLIYAFWVKFKARSLEKSLPQQI